MKKPLLFFLEMRFSQNSAAKVVKMYGVVRVSEKRDDDVEGLFFDHFAMDSSHELADFLAFWFLAVS